MRTDWDKGWATGFYGVISHRKREGYIECEMEDLGHGNPDGTYFIHPDYLNAILVKEEMKNHRERMGPGGIFFLDHEGFSNIIPLPDIKFKHEYKCSFYTDLPRSNESRRPIFCP